MSQPPSFSAAALDPGDIAVEIAEHVEGLAACALPGLPAVRLPKLQPLRP